MHMQPRRPGPGPGSGSGARSAAPPPGPTARGDTAPAAGRMRVVHVTRSRGLHASLSNGRQKQRQGRQASSINSHLYAYTRIYISSRQQPLSARVSMHEYRVRTVWFVSGNGGHAPAPRALIKGCLTYGRSDGCPSPIVLRRSIISAACVNIFVGLVRLRRIALGIVPANQSLYKLEKQSG
jgi:hypothetical protein